MTTLSTDPKTIVSLSRVADVLNEFFGSDVGDDTPFVWWDRSKRNSEIALPMFEPIGYSGAGGRAPLWYQEQVIQWYGQWRDIEVRECQEAGDTVRGGRFKPSAYRVAS